ncbi:MAG TPA: efflux RND transporter periplasmic adaptor subunit [Bacteroidales bacterium]|jgi:cobalt-zinc-cadmium efflux system membrane fusion protein|nr:efflux RND transporter periplasmic adaptor subunit [Bacteroidales bacterium]HQH25120.1 efflux RND transporter periplasmic adaptor subunit [Bacteroidales bacterium]HQJ83202.1 efflux RND transporter periplasmic adaptor subunit [Bacteroidales bacterium]
MPRILLPILLLIIVSCNNQPVHEKTVPDHTRERTGQRRRREAKRRQEEHRHEIFHLKNDSLRVRDPLLLANLKTDVVHPREYHYELTTFGIVKPVPGNYAEVSVPFDGRIIRSNVKLGQKIAAGTPLFEIFSPDYLESVRTFLEAKREKEIREINYRRKKDLFDSEIISRKEYEEARLEYDLADKEFEKNLELLKIYKQDTDNVDISRPFSVVSPIAGEIVRNEIMVGQFLRTDAEPVITVASLDRVRIVANVKEKDLYAVGADDEVEIISESMPDRPLRGRIIYISDIMNEQTRSVEVYVECGNPDKILKSGMFVTVNFRHTMKDVIIIPSEAVYQDSEVCYLFLQTGEGAYARREVSVKSVGNNLLLVRSGLDKGNIIVTDGGIYLR